MASVTESDRPFSRLKDRANGSDISVSCTVDYVAYPTRSVYPYAKRTLDVVAAAVLMVLLLPLIIVTALLVRFTSPGPVLFRQQRVGRHERPFTMYKFRSMIADADPRVHEEAIARYFQGEELAQGDQRVRYKLVSDPRITPLGRILRKTSIDELPQLFNVLRGDMSLVGPRPPLPYEVAHYSSYERVRLTVPQGLTGLWQVKGRSRLSRHDAFALDVEYARTCSFALDCKILLLTVPTLLFAVGGA